ncbi:hypothetical protein Tco_0318401 [Tanacetum coccineum]
MPLSDKTILDSHCFVHELKKEMNDDLEYVKSLEKEVDELESEKADFSNIYDLLLEEYALYNEKQENLRVWLLKILISKKPVPEWPRSSMFKRRLIAADQASVLMAMTSDHNRSELGIHDHSNEPSSSKLVPKVFLSSQDSYEITTRSGINIPPSYSNAEDNRGQKYTLLHWAMNVVFQCQQSTCILTAYHAIRWWNSNPTSCRDEGCLDLLEGNNLLEPALIMTVQSCGREFRV